MADKGMNWVKAEYDWDNIKTRKIETYRWIGHLLKKRFWNLKILLKLQKIKEIFWDFCTISHNLKFNNNDAQ